jgi:hypothetical protein
VRGGALGVTRRDERGGDDDRERGDERSRRAVGLALGHGRHYARGVRRLSLSVDVDRVGRAFNRGGSGRGETEMSTFARCVRGFVAAALVAAGATACGGSATKTSVTKTSVTKTSSSPRDVPPSVPRSTTAASTTTTAPSLPGIPLLMLSVHDLPQGWTVGSDATSTGSFSCLDSYARPGGESARSQVSFRRGAKAGPVIGEVAGAFEPGRAVQAYDAAVRAFTSCKDVAITDNGHRIEGTIRALSLAPVGDASRGWQLEFTLRSADTTVTADIDVVAFRVGSYDGELLASDVGAPDMALVQRLAARAAAKLGDSTT